MGARGPLAKTVGRQGHTTPVRAQLFDEAPDHPPVPEGLCPAVARQWEAFWYTDTARVVADSDLPAVERLFRYRSEWWETEEVYRAMGAFPHEVGQRVVEGSQGQLKMHPLADRLIKLEATMTALETKLGFTPMDRARLGITIGQYQLTWQEVAAGEGQNALPAGADEEAEPIDTEDLGV